MNGGTCAQVLLLTDSTVDWRRICSMIGVEVRERFGMPRVRTPCRKYNMVIGIGDENAIGSGEYELWIGTTAAVNVCHNVQVASSCKAQRIGETRITSAPFEAPCDIIASSQYTDQCIFRCSCSSRNARNNSIAVVWGFHVACDTQTGTIVSRNERD